MSPLPPGSYSPPNDRWGSFTKLAARLPEGSVAVVDRTVARFHPTLIPAIESPVPLLRI